ncbi:hypothetical protein LPJ78_002288 [Coemansia sp. RSA 989]|nr:hypothetical protein LPJ68_004079 [Coemansia sp. RSA 1086]KAJ1749085.1 hypothetical protein LPJ79_004013 [Coemansia sp. RSA 1821]KAJ1865888.1 hypothetical protein LPJ78_002288 [Coemansia sp. RSA 989]
MEEGTSRKLSAKAESTNTSASPDQKPRGNIPATPKPAALKGTDTGMFDSSLETHSSAKDQQPSPFWHSNTASDHIQLTQMERDRALAHSEWETERMKELSSEIQKLLKPAVTPVQSSGTEESANQKSQHEAASDSDKLLSKSVETGKFIQGAQVAKPEADSFMSGHDLSQPLNLYRVPDGIMQVFVIGIHPSTPINRPYVVVRLGDQSFQTSVSKSPTGNWNEGFELIVSYHTQLFGTVHMDVYSNNTLLPDSLIGRAEIKISLLEGFPEIFTSYYEIWDKKLAASTVPDQRQRTVVSKNLGALQVRVNYRFQKLEDPEPKVAQVHGAHISGTVPSQLVNRIASAAEGPNFAAADMTVEELVAAFAKEYKQNEEMIHKHGYRSILRGKPAGADGSKSALGFVQVDEDTVPSSVENTLESEASTKESGASSNWFTELFAGAQAAPQADTSSDVAAAAKATSSDESKAQNTASETSKTAKEKSLMQSLSSMFISPSTFMAIKSLERLVGMFNQGVELSNTEMLGGLLTLYKFYNEADIPGVSCPHSGQIVEGVSKLELSGRYARFALASYGWRALYFFNRGITLMDGAKVDSDVTSVLQYLHIRPEDLLGYEFRSSQLFCPSYFVAHDRQCDAVVLVVRGTMSAEDTVVDLSCEYTKWNGGLVHSGMKASAQWLFLEVVPQIFAYASSQNIRSIRIVGHSLGASTAAILTIMLQESRLRLSELGVGISQFDIHAYCYGPAPCVSDNIADRHRDCIDTFVNRDDLVPRLCYGSMSDFKRMSISAADEADNLAQRLYAPFEDINQQQQRWQERFARLMKIRNDVLAAQENLHLALPGTTYHIVSYRDTAAPEASAAAGASAKSKKSGPRNASLDVAFARRQLFGTTESSTSTQEGAVGISQKTPPPPPPPTPKTIVQLDSVDPDDLADAINTPIRTAFDLAQTNEATSSKQVSVDSSAQKEAVAAAPSDKFVPVWIQKVSNDSFREIILRPTIITDHMPSAYELALAHAIETQVYEHPLRDRRKK